MSKLLLALVAVLSLGLAACSSLPIHPDTHATPTQGFDPMQGGGG